MLAFFQSCSEIVTNMSRFAGVSEVIIVLLEIGRVQGAVLEQPEGQIHEDASIGVEQLQADLKQAPQVANDDLAAIYSNPGWLSMRDHDYDQALR